MSNAVSIIIPVFNGADHVRDAIASALAQQPAPLEVIVVDDGSTDETPAALAAQGDRIRVVRQANAGVSAARNKGAAQARGEWLLFLDADDRLQPGALAALLKAAAPDAGVVFGVVVEDQRGVLARRGNRDCEGPPPQGAIGNFWKAAIITPGAALVRRALHEQIGGFQLPQMGEDRFYWQRCGMLARFVAVDEVVLKKVMRADSASANLRRALVNGVRAQYEFLAWCRTHGFDRAVFGVTDVEIIERVLGKAWRYACSPAFRDILAIARERGLDSPAIRRLRRLAPLLPLRDAAGRAWARCLGRASCSGRISWP